MLYLTRTLDLVVEVNNMEGMEVGKLVKETAINVMQKVYETQINEKSITWRFDYILLSLSKLKGIGIIDVLYVNTYRNVKVHKWFL